MAQGRRKVRAAATNLAKRGGERPHRTRSGRLDGSAVRADACLMECPAVHYYHSSGAPAPSHLTMEGLDSGASRLDYIISSFVLLATRACDYSSIEGQEQKALENKQDIVAVDLEVMQRSKKNIERAASMADWPGLLGTIEENIHLNKACTCIHFLLFPRIFICLKGNGS